MGACNFIEFGKGKTKEEAFKALVQEAEWEYGHDPYNGTISTTSLSRRPAKVIRKRFTEKACQEAVKVAEADDWGEKWESRVIDCGATKGGHMWAFYGFASCQAITGKGPVTYKEKEKEMQKVKEFTIPEIYSTKDYSIFKHLTGNREVTNKRAAKIATSIIKRGYIPVPIVVNEKLEIIDGQGRVEALKQLDCGLPIYYVIIPGLNLDDCVAMNVTGTKWDTMDYIVGYADSGKEDYKNLLVTINSHNLPLSVINCAITGVLATNTVAVYSSGS